MVRETLFGRHNANRLPLQVAIIVPSTRGDKQISKPAFKKRVKKTRKLMDNLWGGDTTVDASGGWLDDGGAFVTERTAVVESFTTHEEFEKKKSKMRKFIHEKQKSWKQSQMGYEIDNVFYAHPQRDWMEDER